MAIIEQHDSNRTPTYPYLTHSVQQCSLTLVSQNKLARVVSLTCNQQMTVSIFIGKILPLPKV